VLCHNQLTTIIKEPILATRPATTRKSPANVTATGTTSTTTAKSAATKIAAPRTAAKKPVRRATSAVARKPVSAIVTKNLKPVIAKTVSASVKTKATPVAAPLVKPKKVKLVRATFSFPDHEHDLLVDLKKRAKKLGKEFKKSEILRAGIAHLVALADAALVNSLAKVERVKTGRPAKKSKKK
jgi:hypothetical protein